MIIRIPKKKKEEVLFDKKKKSDKNYVIKKLREFGFFELNSSENNVKVRKCMPTGLAALDVISARDINGVFGLPFGKQIEISGKPDSGKTSLMLQIAAKAQSLGYTVVWLETEESINETRASIIGANVDEFMMKDPDHLEQALSLIKKTATILPRFSEKNYKDNEGMIILWDSVAATPTKNEYSEPKKKDGDDGKEYGGGGIAEFARIMSMYERKIKKRISDRNVMIIYCNQLKDKIGTFGFGDKSQTYGGNALRFHCSIRIYTTYTGKIKDSKGKNIGITIKVENKKNKILVPWMKFEGQEFLFNSGFNKEQSLLLALEQRELAIKKGTEYCVHGLDTSETYKMGEFIKLTRNNPWIAKKLREAIDVL